MEYSSYFLCTFYDASIMQAPSSVSAGQLTDGVLIPLRLPLYAEPVLPAQLLRGEPPAGVHQALGALRPGGVLLPRNRGGRQHQLPVSRKLLMMCASGTTMIT